MTTQPSTLSLSRCRTLLGSKGVGRVIFTRNALPDVVVVPYRMDGDVLLLAAGHGASWPARVDRTIVALEADHLGEDHRVDWTVLVTGPATRTGDGVSLDLTRCVVRGSELTPTA